MLRTAALGLCALLLGSSAYAEIYHPDLNHPAIDSVEIKEVNTPLTVLLGSNKLTMSKDKSKDKKTEEKKFDDCNSDVFDQRKERKKTFAGAKLIASKGKSSGPNLKQIINVAKELWKIVEDAAPVVNISVDNANALPKGYQCWTDLENWEKPMAKSYEVKYASRVLGFKVTVVKMTYTLVYTWGGTALGRGSYLTNVTVIPSNVEVAIGYKFDADVSVPNVVNVGTRKNPIAGMDVDVSWTIKTAIKESRSVHRFFVQGDGDFVSVN